MISQLLLQVYFAETQQTHLLPLLPLPSFSLSLLSPLCLLLACFAISQFRNSQARPQAQFLANFSAEFPNDLCAACFSWLRYRFLPLTALHPQAALFHLCICFQINSPSISRRGFRSNNNLFPASRLHRNLFAQLCGSIRGSTAQN